MRSKAERRQIVEETFKSGASLAQIARAHGVNANQVFNWRKLYHAGRLEAESPTNQLLPVMIGLPTGTEIWIAAGVTDLRRGFSGLSGIVQTVLEQNPFSGHVFVFRGRRGDLIKLLWWDGDGLCLFAKRLERGRFIWPQAESGSVHLTAAQLSMMLEGIDWRQPVRSW